MSDQALRCNDLLNLVKSLDNLEVVGVYTHFATSTADYYDTFAVEQFEKFKEAVSQIETSGITLKYIHCCNSAATTWYKEAVELCTHVRPVLPSSVTWRWKMAENLSGS